MKCDQSPLLLLPGWTVPLKQSALPPFLKLFLVGYFVPFSLSILTYIQGICYMEID